MPNHREMVQPLTNKVKLLFEYSFFHEEKTVDQRSGRGILVLLSKSFFFSLSFGIVKLPFFFFFCIWFCFISLLILWGHSWKAELVAFFPKHEGTCSSHRQNPRLMTVSSFSGQNPGMHLKDLSETNHPSKSGDMILKRTQKDKLKMGLCLKSAMRI